MNDDQDVVHSFDDERHKVEYMNHLEVQAGEQSRELTSLAQFEVLSVMAGSGLIVLSDGTAEQLEYGVQRRIGGGIRYTLQASESGLTVQILGVRAQESTT